MTAGERGLLLLDSCLGDPKRKCLTTAQLRQLAQRVRDSQKPDADRPLQPKDLIRLGYGQKEAERILELLNQDALLGLYLRQCEKAGCGVLTRLSRQYPQRLRSKLWPDAPAGLWYKGDLSLLEKPMVALVGSRNILAPNAEFARQAGIQAAAQGFVLVSGNARGADRIAQDACLEAGGSVVSVLADSLTDHPAAAKVLFLSEDGFNMGFSTPRALQRNRIIHALPQLVLVAQCAAKTGGTWDGTMRNLKQRWSNVACFDDGSEGAALLEQAGACLIGTEQLQDLSLLATPDASLFSND